MRRLLLGLLLAAWAMPAAWGQQPDKPKKDPKSGPKSDVIQLTGSGKPLKIEAPYLDDKKEGNVRIFMASGNVYAWQGDRDDPEIELRCESLVLWRITTDKKDPTTGQPVQRTEFYAEKNVRFSHKNEVLFGTTMYFDLDSNKGLIKHARYQTELRITGAPVPLIIRAKRFRILDDSTSIAHDAYFTSCNFGDPHYRFHATNILIKTDKKLISYHTQSTLMHRGVHGSGESDHSLFYFPYLVISEERDFPLRRARYGSSSRFGTYVYTRWGQKIGEWGEWFMDYDFRTERGLAIGPGILYDTKDPWGNEYKGSWEGYFLINDRGDDEEETGTPVPSGGRSRIRGQHRHELPQQWRLDLELSIISDRNFLTEFFERELREDKDQESVVYLRKQLDNHQGSALLKYELNDFVTTTEYLPQVRWDTLHEPLHDDNNILKNMYWTGRHQVAYMRRQIDEGEDAVAVDPVTGEESVTDAGSDPDDGRDQVRAETANKLSYPFKASIFRVDPFVGARAGYFSDPLSGGGSRVVGQAGVRITTQFHRFYDMHFPLFDINKLMHVVTPEIRWDFITSSKNADDLFFYDEIDTVDDFNRITLKLMNRLKTRRFLELPVHEKKGLPEHEKKKEEKIKLTEQGKRKGSVVEFLYFDIELPLFPNSSRDNGGASLGDLDVEARWRIREWLTLSMDTVVRLEGQDDDRDKRGAELLDSETEEEGIPDLRDREEGSASPRRNEGAGVRVFNIGLSITNPDRDYPQWALFVGNRFARDVSNALILNGRLSLSRKWELEGLVEYDTKISQLLQAKLLMRRHFHHLAIEFTIDHDGGAEGGSGDTSFSVGIVLRGLLERAGGGTQEGDEDAGQESAFDFLGNRRRSEDVRRKSKDEKGGGESKPDENK